MPTTTKTKGIACILLAALGFSLMTMFVRLSGDLPTMQKAFFRNFIALFVATGALVKDKTPLRIAKGNRLDIFMRCLFGTTGLIANFYAIDKIGIADANMLNKLSPFFAILLSIFILKEKPNRVDIVATVIAFIGSLFIIRPTGVITKVLPSLIGLYGGFGAGCAYVFVRKLGKKGEKTPIIVFCFSLFSCLVTLPYLIFDYHHMKPIQLVYLILAGVGASLGQFSITNAYRYAPAKELSVFDYTQVLFAAIFGIIIFGEYPHPLSLLGYAIIIGTAVFKWKQLRQTPKA